MNLKRELSLLEGREVLKEIAPVIEAVLSKQGHTNTSFSYLSGLINQYVKVGEEEFKIMTQILIAGSKKDKDPVCYDMQSLITENAWEVINVFKKYNANNEDIKDCMLLMDNKPLVPLTGEESEWSDELGDSSQQNNRYSSVFREKGDTTNETAHILEGEIFSENGGVTWFTRGGGNIDWKDPEVREKVISGAITTSCKPITFPFDVANHEPKKTYLDPVLQCRLDGRAEWIKVLEDAFKLEMDIDNMYEQNEYAKGDSEKIADNIIEARKEELKDLKDYLNILRINYIKANPEFILAVLQQQD